IQLADVLVRIAAIQYRRLLIPGPCGQRRIGIHADTEDHDVASVVEELGVLITVRLHLNRSALCPRLEEECEDDGLAPIVREANRVAEDSIPRRTDDGEFGRHRADLGYGGTCWLLGRQASPCGKERGRGDDGEDPHPV